MSDRDQGTGFRVQGNDRVQGTGYRVTIGYRVLRYVECPFP